MISILIVGVGGQGTLLASRLLGNAMIKAGLDVKVSEVHGMSQRGGSVVTYVRSGEKVFSPIIELGEADYILAFEQLEAARYLSFLKPGGTVILNTQKIDPMPVIIGSAEYPPELVATLEQTGAHIKPVDALELAEEAGSIKSVNVVLIGVIAKTLAMDKQLWLDTIKDTVPAHSLDVNLNAFELGYNRD